MVIRHRLEISLAKICKHNGRPAANRSSPSAAQGRWRRLSVKRPMSSKYAIVLSGLYDPDKIRNVKAALAYAEEVVVSTWVDAITAPDRAEIEALGATVMTQPDPGAPHITYVQSGVRKSLSAGRQILSARAGLSQVSKEFAIRSRLDATLDYDRLYEIWTASGRRFGSVNLTSVCPHRLFSYPYLFAISDWCHVGRTADLISGYLSSEIVEERLVRKAPLTCGDMTWHSRLAVEQIVTLLLSGSDRLYDLEIKPRLAEYSADDWAEHQRVLSQFANVKLQDVRARTDRYRFLSGRWLAWDDIQFRDNGLLKTNLFELALFLVSQARSRVRAGRANKLER